MRVGITEAPPWITRTAIGSDAEPSGVEAALIRKLAEREGVRIRWKWGSLENHFMAAEAFEIDLVAGGIIEDSPWHKRLGFTAPYYTSEANGAGDALAETKPVLAVPPGENAWLARVESHLRSHESEIPAMVAAEERR